MKNNSCQPSRLVAIIWLLTMFSPLLFSGCSSLGLSTWPAQFPLLKKTKEFAAFSARPNQLSNELIKTTLPDYYLEPGDRILIEPVKLDSDIGSFGDQKIQIDGSIDLGKYGRLRVAGMTVEQIEGLVENQVDMQHEGHEQINVQLVESNAAEIYVLGEVGSPAAYPVEGHEHVLDAILRAGGLTSKASPCDIVLVRPTAGKDCRVVLPVCYRQITQLGDASSNYQLRPGDRIVVGSRTFWEEIAFWKQQEGCQCCDRSSCTQQHPASVKYQNRFIATDGQPGFASPVSYQTVPTESVETPAMLPLEPADKPLEENLATKRRSSVIDLQRRDDAKPRSFKVREPSSKLPVVDKDDSLFLAPLK